MGNSIEEDIAKVNTYIELVLEKDYCNCNELNTILGKHCDGSKNVAYAIEHILSDYKRLLKENEELKEKESRIYKEVQESLSFEKFLIVKDIGPDLFNLGRFYISQIIYDILNDVQNPEGIHKENKCIQYIDYIPVQKVKDKIEEYKNMLKTCNKAKDIDRIKAINERILELQELIEKER